jgi:hypothetical protein
MLALVFELLLVKSLGKIRLNKGGEGQLEIVSFVLLYLLHFLFFAIFRKITFLHF